MFTSRQCVQYLVQADFLSPRSLQASSSFERTPKLLHSVNLWIKHNLRYVTSKSKAQRGGLTGFQSLLRDNVSSSSPSAKSDMPSADDAANEPSLVKCVEDVESYHLPAVGATMNLKTAKVSS